MSADWGRPEVTGRRSKRRFGPEADSGHYICSIEKILDLYAVTSRLAEIHQFPDGTIVETPHTHAPLEPLDRDLAGEAVIGAVKADQPGDDPRGARAVRMACRMVFSR